MLYSPHCTRRSHLCRGSGLSLALGISAIVIAPFGILNGRTALLNPQTLLIGIAVAILSTLIPFSLEMEALRRLSSRIFGVLMSIEPAAATLIGFLVLREAIGLRELLAIGLIVSASVGVSLNSRAQHQA